MKKRFAIVPGDGIGVDVTREAVKTLEAASQRGGFELELEHFELNADRYLETGVTMPPGTHDRFREFDAVYMGAFGDPRVPDSAHARDILLGTRFELDLYINLRPIRCISDRLCPLRDFKARDIDFTVFRENTEGMYVGMGGIFKKGTPDEVAVQEDVNTRKGVERVIRAAFEYAKAQGKTRVTMADKSNAMRFGHDLWLRCFREVAEEFPGIEAQHLYIDAMAMELIRNPAEFQVIVTCNLFGDIVTDLGAQLQGGLGMAASGNIRPDGTSMFEPVHGSAPPLAGKDKANPFGAVLTAAMMLEHTGLPEAAGWLEQAVASCLESGTCTEDVGGKLGTTATGDALAALVRGQ